MDPGLAAAGDRTAVRHSMISVGRSLAMFEFVNGWMHLEPFRNRRRFIMDGLRDHRNRRFRVSIPTLLPQIEGIASEVFAPAAANTGLRSLLASTAADCNRTVGPALVQTVSLLWDHRDFTLVSPTSRQINRHLVLHGRSTGYGTEENSVKVLFRSGPARLGADDRWPSQDARSAAASGRRRGKALLAMWHDRLIVSPPPRAKAGSFRKW